jgi:hypothetical protein
LVAEIINPLLKPHAAFGNSPQHDKPGGAGVFRSVVVSKDDSKGARQIRQPVSAILPETFPGPACNLKAIEPAARQSAGAIFAGRAGEGGAIERTVMDDRRILQGRADNRENPRHRRFAGDVRRTNAVHANVYGVKLIFWINENRQRLEDGTGLEMNEPDRAKTAKISIRRLDV